MIEFARHLVATPSLSGQEGDVIDLCSAEMGSLGYRVSRDKAGNLLGTVGEGGPRLLFDVHADTVAPAHPLSRTPTNGSDVALDAGRLWGRGSCDVKGPLAALIYGVADAARAGRLRATVGVAVTTLEEVLEGAALALVIDDFSPEGVVIVEPSRGQVALAQRGRAEILIEVTGRAAHAAYPERGANALAAGAAILCSLERREVAHDPELGATILVATEAATEPFPGVSVVPNRCHLRLDRRMLPGESAEMVLAELAPFLAEAERYGARASAAISDSTVTTYTGVELAMPRFFPAWRARSGPFVDAVLASAPAGPPAVFCTNGSLSAGRGIPTVIFGPGDPERAHQDDEYIDLDELEGGRAQFADLAAMNFPQSTER